MNYYFDECIKEAQISNDNGDIPIGSVVVYKNKIIGRGHNERNNTNDVTAHAEIIAIKEAAKQIGDWRLNECDLYVTLEPCNMCKEIIKESRIENVYFLLKKDDYKYSYNKTNFIFVDDEKFQQNVIEYKNKLSNFFIVNCNR